MKVGILSKYFASSNYGGNLQAYALCKAFEEKGIDAEQICYRASNRSNRSVKENLSRLPKYILSSMTKSINKKLHKEAYKAIAERKSSIKPFNQMIKHSEIVYTPETIFNANHVYDAFVCGSDQVWYPDVFCPAFSLSFANKKKKKYSYAASIASNRLPSNRKDYYRASLQGYNALSVREEKAKVLLEEIGINNIQVVLDPVFLIEPDRWLEIADDCLIDEKYLFCYFLGEDPLARKMASKYGKMSGLKIVTIPYLQNEYRKSDDGFGDIKLSGVSPNAFLSLIKHSEIVFTDSFHASAFSTIFHKQFFVFERLGGEEMNSRLLDFLRIVDCLERYINNNEKMTEEYLYSVQEIKYTETMNAFDDMKRISYQFFDKIVEECLEQK